MQVLLEHNKAEVLQQWHDIMPALLDALTSQSDGVVNQVCSYVVPVSCRCCNWLSSLAFCGSVLLKHMLNQEQACCFAAKGMKAAVHS